MSLHLLLKPQCRPAVVRPAQSALFPLRSQQLSHTFPVRSPTCDGRRAAHPDTHHLSCGRVLERHDDELLLKWTENQVRAYQLLRIFLHEPGPRHDALTSRRGSRLNRGESYVEAYAEKYEAVIWDRYLETFPLL